METAIAYPTFFGAFKRFYPDLEVFKKGKKYDLVIFSGGEDINPAIYGQRNTYSYCNPERDSVEQGVFDYLRRYQKDTKVLGVCRGHQLINACLGGSLVQDMFSELGIEHKFNHSLEFTPVNSMVRKLYYNEKVNSLHHQGVIREGEYLNITSRMHGIIESCESKNIITVQFHPELMGDFKFFEELNNWVVPPKKEVLKEEPKLSEEDILMNKMSEELKRRKEYYSTPLNMVSSATTSGTSQDVPIPVVRRTRRPANTNRG